MEGARAVRFSKECACLGLLKTLLDTGDRSTEKWGARKAGGGESRGEGQKRKGMEGWVKGEQPGIVQSRA